VKLRGFLVMALFSVVLGGGLSSQAARASRGRNAAAPEGAFFIVSSVDVDKKQIVLKLPTEVTELMLATERTVYLDERGRPMRFQDLRAGDTVYVVSKTADDGTHLAQRIRRGPMTVDELHRRYLNVTR
jgi:hypothetical protein